MVAFGLTVALVGVGVALIGAGVYLLCSGIVKLTGALPMLAKNGAAAAGGLVSLALGLAAVV